MHVDCFYLHLRPLRKHGALAQLVEQRTENPCVPGSIPGGTTIKIPNSMFGIFGFMSFLSIIPLVGTNTILIPMAIFQILIGNAN